MTRRKPRVRFVYKQSGTYLGSTLMRAHQMCDLARAHLGDRYDFGLIGLPRLVLGTEALWIAIQPKGTVYIFVKDTIDRLTEAGRLALQRMAGGVCVDYIDRHLNIMVPTGIDVHIACSYASLNAMDAKIRDAEPGPFDGEARLVLHNVDSRLAGVRGGPADALRPVYFGSPHATRIPEALAPELAVLDATTTAKMAENYRRIVDYNYHYCIRLKVDYPHERGHKPFLKGFTAAALGANVLANTDEDDVLEFLGDDYPYLVNTDGDDRQILDVMDKARRTFGKDEWKRGLAIMDGVARRSAPGAIATQLDAILKDLTS